MSATTRKHPPLRHLSDEQLDELIQDVRDEKKLRREDNALYQAELERHARKGARGQNFQLTAMRRNVRVWR